MDPVIDQLVTVSDVLSFMPKIRYYSIETFLTDFRDMYQFCRRMEREYWIRLTPPLGIDLVLNGFVINVDETEIRDGSITVDDYSRDFRTSVEQLIRRKTRLFSIDVVDQELIEPIEEPEIPDSTPMPVTLDPPEDRKERKKREKLEKKREKLEKKERKTRKKDRKTREKDRKTRRQRRWKGNGRMYSLQVRALGKEEGVWKALLALRP